ncbi:homocysteine S-methyltransferase family protein, partial [Streptomyces sp. NPDC127079]|uniref:homocysteine S-methyltransferase family protein n=1 Tax=Streptomyces sp. NPDC127079 TaxID=3347132 RepID=UPI003651CC6E
PPARPVGGGGPGAAPPPGGGVGPPPTRSWLGAQDEIADLAPAWLGAGALLVGGCCRVGPAEIAELAARLRPSTADR